jgi:triphosphatase
MNRAAPEPSPESAEASEAPPEQPLSLEFALPVTEAARLQRFPILAALRLARISTSAEEIRWLDTAEGALAAEGMLVEAPRRGPRRLVTLAPASDAPWHPGLVPLPLALLGPQESPDAAGDAPLAPFAAFSGKRQTQRLRLGAAEVQASLLQGHLRAVAAEREVARLLLTGPAPAVLDLARRLAAALPLIPPSQSLAAEALALATGQAPKPRRRGPPDTSGAESLEAVFTHSIGHLLEVALFYAPIARLGLDSEGVHQLRVALRRLRSVLKVFRPVSDGPESRALDGALRDLLKLLGPARDWDVFLAGIGAEMAALLPEDRRMRSLLRAAEGERQAAYHALAAVLDGPAWRLALLEGLNFLTTRPWRLRADAEAQANLNAPPHGFAATVLEKRWQRLRKAGAEVATMAPEALHELRLDAKRLRYAAEVFAPVFPHKAARRFQRRLADLQEELGRSNDAAVARGLMQALDRDKDMGRAWAIGAVEGWCLARSATDRDAVVSAWKKLLAKDPFWSGD